MSWGYSYVGSKEEVSAMLAAFNPDTCGAYGAVEKGEAAFIKYHALALVDALDISETPYAKGNRVKVEAGGSHSWAGSSKTPIRATFSLTVERVE